MATVKDILNKNKKVGGTAVTGVNYLENLSQPITAANTVTPKVLSASTNGTVLDNVKQTVADAVNGTGQWLNTNVVEPVNNAVSATGEALDKFGNTVVTGATNLYNGARDLLSGKEETTATAAPVTETPTEPISYTSTEYLKQGQNQIDWNYDENINYADQTRQQALQRAEEAKQSAKVEAEALFRQNAANYGIRGEQMLDQGLAGGGYSEFLEGKNMETRAANYARADADAYAAAQNAEAQYNEDVRQANLLRQQGEAELLEKRYAISEQLRAERDAKIKELVGLANSGDYTVEQLKALWSAYEGIYGALSDAEINGLLDTTVQNATRSRLDEFIDKYGLGSSEEEFAQKLVTYEKLSPQQAADMAAAAYAMSNKEQNAQNAEILEGYLAQVQAGGLTAKMAKYLYEQETGKKIDENSEEYKLIVEAANKYGSEEKTERRYKVMSAYTELYAQVLSGALSAAEAEDRMSALGYGGAVGDDVSNALQYSTGFAEAERKYKKNRAPTLIEDLLNLFPGDGANALDYLAGDGYTPEEIADYKKRYFVQNSDGTYGARKTTLTDENRISLIASAATAIRSGSMDLDSAIAELALYDIELAQGSKEMQTLKNAYDAWVEAEAASNADMALYFLMNNGLPVSRDAVKDYFMLELKMSGEEAEDRLDTIFDASGKLVYQPFKTENSTTGGTGTTGTDEVQDITKMTVAEILQYLQDNNVNIGGEGGTVDYSVETIYNILKYNPDFTMSKEDFAKIYDKDNDGNVDADVLAELSKPGGGPEPEPEPEQEPEPEPEPGEDSGVKPIFTVVENFKNTLFGDKMSNTPDKSYVSLIKAMENSTNEDGSKEYDVNTINYIKQVFETVRVTSVSYKKNTGFRRNWTEGDNIKLEDADGNKYKVEVGKTLSSGEVYDAAKKVGIAEGAVFAYKGQLYMMGINSIFEINQREHTKKQSYQNLWKKAYEEQLDKFANDDITQIKNYGKTTKSGTKVENLGGGAETPAPTPGDGDLGYVEGLIENIGTGEGTGAGVTTGSAWLEQNSNGYYVEVDGKYTQIRLGGSVKTKDGVVAAARGLGEGEIFIYGEGDEEKLYAIKDGQVYEIKGSKNKLEKIASAIKDNAKDNKTYDDGFSTLAKNDKKSYPTSTRELVRLDLEGNKYRLEVASILGEKTALYNNARENGVSAGTVFAHKEDIYLMGDDAVYKLRPRAGIYNGDYDRLKVDATGNPIDSNNIYGNRTVEYLKNLTDEGTGGGGDGGGGSTQNSTTNTDEGEVGKDETTKVQFDLNTSTAEEYAAEHNDKLKSGWTEIAFDSVEAAKDYFNKQGIENPDSIVAKLPKNGKGELLWHEFKLPAVEGKKQLYDVGNQKGVEGVKRFEKGIGALATVGDNAGKIYTGGSNGKVYLELDLETPNEDHPLYGATSVYDGWFEYNGDLYFGQGNGIGTQYQIFKVTGGKDYENAKKLANGENPYAGQPSGQGGQPTQNGESNKKKNEVTPTAAEWAITRGGASFQTDGALFGIDRGLERGDNITVEIGNKSYAVESKGKVDDAIKNEIATDDNGSIQNNEVFKYSDGKGNSKLYLKKIDSNGTVSYYEIGQRWYALGQDNKLADAIQGAVDTGSVKTMSKETLDTKTVKDADGKYVETKTNSVKVGGADKLKLGRSSKLRINNRKYDVTAVNSYGSGSKPYDLAFAKDSGVGENVLFMYEGDVYVKRKDDVVKLGDPIGLDYTEDLKKLLTAESYNNVEVVFLEGLRKKNIGKNYVYGYDDDEGTIWTKSKVKIDKAGNEAIKAAADTVSNDTVFKLNDDYYLKVGTDDGYAVYAIDRNNVNGQKKTLAEFVKNHAAANFAEAKAEDFKSAMAINNKNKAVYEAGEEVSVSFGGGVLGPLTGDIQIKQVYETSSLPDAAKEYVSNASEGTLFVYKGEVYLVGVKGGEKVVCSVKNLKDSDYDIIKIIKDEAESNPVKTNPGEDGSNNEPQGFYGSNLVESGKTAAASTSGGRGFNYSEMV